LNRSEENRSQKEIKMKRVLAIVIGVLLLSVGMAFAAGGAESSGAGGGKITVAYVGFPHTTPFWVQMSQYVAEEAKAQGITLLDMTPSEQDAAQQKAAVDDAINRGVQGIIIGSIDNRAFGESLRKAAAKKIVCVAVDTAIDDPQITALAQTDNLASARVLGQYMVDHLPTKGTVIILGGTLGHQTGDARRDGVKQVLEANGFDVVFRAADWDSNKANEIAMNELGAHPDTVAIFGCWDPGAVAGLAAVKQKGLLDKVKVFGFDGLPMAVKSIQDGELTATIKQDNKQMAQVIVRSLVAQIKGQPSVKKLLIDGFVIDKSNADKYAQ
jgi:ribose transport system substrate-binding protein